MTWLERVAARPPLSWVGWCWEQMSTPIRVGLDPLARWRARHKARELEELAAVLERTGMPAQAAQVAMMAARWRNRA